MKRNTRAAFTLAELLIVVAVLAVLVAIAIPVFAGSLDQARDTVCAANRTSAQHLVSVEFMLDNQLSAETAKAHVDEQIGTAPCPRGGEYIVEREGGKAAGALQVRCTKHGLTALEIAKKNASTILKLESIQAYFTAGASRVELNSTGANFGGKIREELAKSFKTTQEFEFRIYRDTKLGQYYLYLFEPLKDRAVGDEVTATRYTVDAATLEIIGAPTSGLAPVIQKTMDDGKTQYLAIDTSKSGTWKAQ